MSNRNNSSRLARANTLIQSQKLQILSFSPQKTQNSSVFITNKSQKPSPQQEVYQRHGELNNYIQILDEKVKQLVQHNQAEILCAYKNHLAHVRLQIQEFKDQTLNTIKNDVGTVQKLAIMQKQIILFRQQALKLYRKNLQKDKIIQNMKLKTDQITKAHDYMQQRLKFFMKSNKQQQAKIVNMQIQLAQYKQKNVNKKLAKSMGSVGYGHTHNIAKNAKRRILTQAGLMQSRVFSQMDRTIQQPNTKKQQVQWQQLHQFQVKLPSKSLKPATQDQKYTQFQSKQFKIQVRAQEQPCETFKRTGYSMFANTSVKKSKQNQKKRIRGTSALCRSLYDQPSISQLPQFFRKSVETVKKQIAIRRQINSMNFYKPGSPITIDQFKKIDFFRLLQLVFKHQKITKILHKQLFQAPKA